MEVIDKRDHPNAIHRWNKFKREVIKKSSYHKNHFSPTKEKREEQPLSQATKYHDKIAY